MKTLRVWIILSWIALPAGMLGGTFLLQRFLNHGAGPTPFQLNWLRAGHAHGNVLLLMSLLYYTFMDQTSLSASVKRAACVALFVCVLAQFGGFFLHAIVGQPNQASIGTTVTVVGAALLACAVVILIYGLITTRSTTTALDELIRGQSSR